MTSLDHLPIVISSFNSSNAWKWDHFIKESGCFTFQFQRCFLDVGESTRDDESLVASDEGGSILAVFPINYNSDLMELVSHSRSSYGGVVFSQKLGILQRLLIYRMFVQHLQSKFPNATLKVRLPPVHVSTRETEVESWILWRTGFLPNSVVLHSGIDLRDELSFKKGRVRRDRITEFDIFEADSPGQIVELWQILVARLMERHATTPVHSSNEIVALKDTFPRDIRIFLGARFDQILGGLVFFNTRNAFHLQYMAIGTQGRKLSAGDLLIQKALEVAISEQYTFFNFGHSNEDNGLTLNEDLWSFKSKFGSKGFTATTWTYNFLS